MAQFNGKVTSLVESVAHIMGRGASAFTDGWFGPSSPLEATAPKEVAGRQFDYATGYNINSKPRQGEAITFDFLRSFADSYDLLRLVIETRKDQMAKLPWVIRVKDNPNTDIDEATLHNVRCEELENFFAFPDKEHGWDTWLRMLLEDLLVIDAPTVYVRKTKGGQVYAVEPIDGATIKRVLDTHGRTPNEPDPAYQQVLKGLPAVDYTRQELLYLPRNPRTHKVYGYSPVEQIITTVNIALRRQAHQLGFYTDGSTPDLVFQVPAEWTPDQIKQFEDYWNNLLSGNIHERRRTRFVPAGVTPFDTKAHAIKDEYDDWLARVVCFAFSISPQAFVKDMNRATAQTAQEASLSEGLSPLMQWVKGLMDRIIQQVFGYTDIEFKWDTQESIKPKERAEIDQIYINSKVVHPDEIRADRFNLKAMDSALRESLSPAPVTTNQDQSGAKQDEVQEKFAKAKKRVAPINREREIAVQARLALQQQLKAFFQQQAQDIALQVIAQKDTFGKAINIQDLVSYMLDKVSFGAWTGIAAWFSQSTEVIALDGVQVALSQLDVELDERALKLANAQAVDFAKERAAELVGMKYKNGELVPNPNPKFTITESTREMLRANVTQAMEEGWSNDRLADAIVKNPAFGAERADMIARTETAIADVRGNRIAYEQTGLVGGKEWIAAPNCCSKCSVLNGRIVLLDDYFVKDSYFKDPPLHPHCRCDMLPVLVEDMPKDLQQYNAKQVIQNHSAELLDSHSEGLPKDKLSLGDKSWGASSASALRKSKALYDELLEQGIAPPDSWAVHAWSIDSKYVAEMLRGVQNAKINAELRTEFEQMTQDMIERLNHLFVDKRAKITTPIQVYRGEGMSQSMIDMVKGILEQGESFSVLDRSFQSNTLSLDIAQDFANRGVKNGLKPVIFVTELGKGVKAIDITSYHYYHPENEILLDRELKRSIVGMYEREDGVIVMQTKINSNQDIKKQDEEIIIISQHYDDDREEYWSGAEYICSVGRPLTQEEKDNLDKPIPL